MAVIRLATPVNVEVADHDDPPRVDEERGDDRPGDEDRLAADQARERPAPRRPDRARADASAHQRRDVGAGLPAQHHQAVQRPDVDVLQPVPALRRLVRRQAREGSLVDVVVVAVDVGVGVVRDVVLDPPGVAREADERVRRPAHQVVQAPRAEVRAVVRVVLHAEADQHRREHEAREAHHSDGRRRGARTSASRRRAPRGRRRRPSSHRASGEPCGGRVRTGHRPRPRASCRG